ncbi:unnamed protein product [Rotaria sp. Silwood2]|nr:unnamed protein product [Rotaria sp. Silwood2]CAF4599085.1 unnamed protein product [Rotaria sp. Silwood2]
MVSKYDAYVAMGHYGVSETSIYTDCVASCHFLLMDGRYNGIPFAFMDHNPFPITRKNPSEDLKLLLTSLLSKLTKKLPKHKRKPFMIKKLKDLCLLVGGGTVSGTIHEREAYSLLRNPNKFIHDRLKLILEDKYVYLFNELHHRTVIINPVVFETSDDDDKHAAEYRKLNFSSTFCII